MCQTLTQRFISMDSNRVTRHNEGDWQGEYQEIPGFSSFNDAGVECEVGEFLYSMVRLLKPAHVLETGTHWGISAGYIGLGLLDNKEGRLDTFEFLPENQIQALERIKRMQLDEVVTPHFGDVATFQPEVQYKLMLLDTEPQTRFAELQKFWPYLEEGGFVFIHDLHPHMHQIPNEEHGFAWPYGPVTLYMKELVRSGAARPFHFRTPRGFTGFYKVGKDDYDWGKSEESRDSLTEQMQAVGH